MLPATIASCLLFLFGFTAGSVRAATVGTIAFENARLLTGTSRGILENATLLISGDHIVNAGPADEVEIPASAQRIDASGMTIMPAFIDTHLHTNQSPNSLQRDLRRLAYFGVGTVASLGVDTSDAAFEVRDRPLPGAARILTAGRGITAPEVGRETAPYWVETVEEARFAVQQNIARGVDLIKIWVDDRNDRFPKLNSELYSVIIDEAHSNGLQVTAHVFDLEDAKGLLRAGVDAFAHGVRDQDIDDEFLQLLEQHAVVMNPNLPPRGVISSYQWLASVLPLDSIRELEASSAKGIDARAFFQLQARNLRRMHALRVPIVLGTDTSFDFPGGDRPWDVHIEMQDMVEAGMTPADVILAATRNAAEFLQLADRGTLAAGKSADFVILYDNPLEDITYTRSINAVYLRGRAVNRDKLFD